MITENIPDLIKTYVPFVRTRKEWETCICPICNDYKDRGGFVLDSDEIVYHCFNCGYDAKYAVGETYITKKMNRVLESFGIDKELIDKATSYYFFNKTKTKASNKNTDEISYPKKIELPKSFRPLILSNNENTFDEVFCEYIKSRSLNIDAGYYISDDPLYFGYLIIPYKRFNNFIYWQGRNILDDDSPRYINHNISKDNILFNFDLLTSHDLHRIYVAEGVFDSLCLQHNVIGLCGSSLCDNKIKILKACKKEIVFVIDSDISGLTLGKKALSNGFKITHLPFDYDINSYCCEYGKIATCVLLHKNIKSGFSAELHLQLIQNKINKEKNNREY